MAVANLDSYNDINLTPQTFTYAWTYPLKFYNICELSELHYILCNMYCNELNNMGIDMIMVNGQLV